MSLNAFRLLWHRIVRAVAPRPARSPRSDPRTLVEREHLFRTLTEEALVGIYIIQGNRFRYVNPALANIFGYNPDEIIDRLGPLDLTHPSDREKVASNVNRRLSGEVEASHYVLQGLRRDGTQITCEVLGRLTEYEGAPAIIGTLLDITERRHAEEAEQEQRVLAEALRDTAIVLNSTLDLDQVLKRILDNVGRVVPHDGANVVLVVGDEARVVRCQGYYLESPARDISGLSLPLVDFYYYREMSRVGEPLMSVDTAKDPHWIELPHAPWIASYLGAPILRQGEVIGFLNLDSRTPNFFTPVHAERLQAFASQVAIALQNARLFQQLEQYNESLEMAVTARTVELQRAMEQLAVTLNSSPDAILLLHRDGTIDRGNPAFYEAFGYEGTELSREPLIDFVTPADRDLLQAALDNVLEEGGKPRLELHALRKDQTTFDIEVALAPVWEEGQVHGAVCTLSDISRLKEVDRMKDAFISNVSHELRTPITSLKLYHDLLLRNPDRRQIYLERVGREINRLMIIIEDLLRLSRLDRNQVELVREAVDLNTLVRQYVEDRLPLASEKQISLIWEPGPALPLLHADRSLLEQVVSILLGNAFNYTPPGGQIWLSLHRREQEGHLWVGYRVRDNGLGIPEEEIPHLFERFFRGQAAQATGAAGTGLGLAIAQEIVTRHAGHIDVCSRTGDDSGTAFTVWLPA